VAEKTEATRPIFDKTKEAVDRRTPSIQRGLAFEAFRTALDSRLKQEGKLKLMPEKLKGFGTLG